MTGLEARVEVPGRLAAEVRAEPGDVVAVVGPNGAGKTTLLHALAGIVPSAGRIDLSGRELTRLPMSSRHVGLVFQDRLLFPHLDARENVAFGLRSTGTGKTQAHTRAQAWLDRLGVGDLAHRKPDQLSGGQAQRVALARALVTHPDLLLLDEPFAALDVAVATGLRLDLVRHLAGYDGITIVVTHDALDALTLANRVIVLDRGRIAQEGTAHEVAARPQTEHVARLVGLNVIREGSRLAAFSPTVVTVSLQPPQGSARHQWHGPIVAASPHGDAVRLLVDAGQDLLADVTPAAISELGLHPGRRVWLSAKETAVRWYDATPGQPATLTP